MIVYVLWMDDYDQDIRGIKGIFDSKEKAEDAHRELNNEDFDLSYVHEVVVQ